jgi:1,4-dihydroxy-2-naphthoate octaprenyltransferase
MNLFDDYFDYKVKESGFRDTLNRKGFRARISKCDYLTSGQATVRELLFAGILFGATALLIGVIIWLFRGNFILWISLSTAVIGLSYSAPPLRLSYHGLGEWVIGLIFGPLLMTGVYYATCGHWDCSMLFVSIPVGVLVTNIVYSHSIMDYEPDKEVGKMTFAILLKTQRNMLIFHRLLVNSAYVIIAAGVFSGYLSYGYLIVFLTFPLAVYHQYLMVQFVKNPDRSFNPKWWMGPMGDRERIKTAGIEWFMIRWLLARNLLSFFCLVILIVSFIP